VKEGESSTVAVEEELASVDNNNNDDNDDDDVNDEAPLDSKVGVGGDQEVDSAVIESPPPQTTTATTTSTEASTPPVNAATNQSPATPPIDASCSDTADSAASLPAAVPTTTAAATTTTTLPEQTEQHTPLEPSEASATIATTTITTSDGEISMPKRRLAPSTSLERVQRVATTNVAADAIELVGAELHHVPLVALNDPLPDTMPAAPSCSSTSDTPASPTSKPEFTFESKKKRVHKSDSLRIRNAAQLAKLNDAVQAQASNDATPSAQHLVPIDGVRSKRKKTRYVHRLFSVSRTTHTNNSRVQHH
jgi:hypothetical protein